MLAPHVVRSGGRLTGVTVLNTKKPRALSGARLQVSQPGNLPASGRNRCRKVKDGRRLDRRPVFFNGAV